MKFTLTILTLALSFQSIMAFSLLPGEGVHGDKERKSPVENRQLSPLQWWETLPVDEVTEEAVPDLSIELDAKWKVKIAVENLKPIAENNLPG